MATATDWLGILVGMFGTLYAAAVVLSVRDDSPSGRPPFLLRSPLVPLGAAIVALILAGYCVTLLRQPPFSEGGRLGLGFLLGGGWAFVAALLLPLARWLPPQSTEPGRRWVVGSALSAGASAWTLAGVNVALLVFKGNPLDALVGFAIGFCMVAILTRASGDAALLPRGHSSAWEGLEPQAVLAATLVAACGLGVHHFELVQQRVWWALPIATAGVAIVAAVIGSRIGAIERLRERTGLRLLLSSVSAVMILAVLALLIATKALHSWPMFGCVAAGLAAAGLIVWLIVGGSVHANGSVAFQSAAFGALAVVVVVAASFRLLAAYGVALALSAAWTVVVVATGGLSLRETEPDARWRNWGQSLMPFLAAWALIPLYRLFMEHCEAAAPTPSVHYAFIGLAVGVIVVLAYAGYGARTVRISGTCSPRGAVAATLLRTGLLGLLSVGLPLLFVVLWGERATVGLLAGLAVGSLALAVWQSSAADATRLPPGTLLFALGSALAAVQFTHLVSPIGTAARATKLIIVIALAAAAILWVVVDAALAARRARREARA
ncbi:MAG: hypothetical protein ACE5O2_00865 [Armatimonadota bacterium]